MDIDPVDVKLEDDDDQTSITNFVSANIISHDSVVSNFLLKLFE